MRKHWVRPEVRYVRVNDKLVRLESYPREERSLLGWAAAAIALAVIALMLGGVL